LPTCACLVCHGSDAHLLIGGCRRQVRSSPGRQRRQPRLFCTSWWFRKLSGRRADLIRSVHSRHASLSGSLRQRSPADYRGDKRPDLPQEEEQEEREAREMRRLQVPACPHRRPSSVAPGSCHRWERRCVRKRWIVAGTLVVQQPPTLRGIHSS
jgi:hypothetical protein